MSSTTRLPTLVVSLDADRESRSIIASTIGGKAHVIYLSEMPQEARGAALSEATMLLARQTATELQPNEPALLARTRLIQFVTAGVDYVPLSQLPASIPIACNGGAFAEPMAEHALMMTLAALKRLPVEHAKVASGTFDQHRPNRMLAGSVCGILGLGGFGTASARVMRSLGVRVHAVNRSGITDQPIDWIGSMADLDRLLPACDILIVALPLTPATLGLIGKRQLNSMKPDAIIVNLARGEIIDEAALFEHLQSTPTFTACIDAWWIEPIRHGRFRMDHPFTSLPNVIASPHNSASVAGGRANGLRRALENILRVLDGSAPLHVVPVADHMK